MQLIIDIQNESIAEKIKAILNAFKEDGVKIQEPKTKNQKPRTNLSDAYIKKHWRELIITNVDNSDYYKSDQYMIDRAEDWEERGKA